MNWEPTPENDLKRNGDSDPAGGKQQRDGSPDARQSRRERRMGVDRRHFSYTLYVPERRLGQERRAGSDTLLSSDS